MTEKFDDNGEHPLAETLRLHYERHVAPDVAARHVMAIHREAARIRIAERRALRHARRPRRAVVASLAGAMLLGSSTGALAASDDALPGDLLYPVKRSSETARLLAAMPFSAQGTVHLDIATERAEEAQAAAQVRPGIVGDLVVQAQAALEAARRENAPNAEVVAAAVNTTVQQALVAVADPAGADPAAAPQVAPSPSTSEALSEPAAVPSDGASPGASEAPSSPGTPETATVVTPTPTPAPSITAEPAPVPDTAE
jgi:hypothetical protein